MLLEPIAYTSFLNRRMLQNARVILLIIIGQDLKLQQ